MSDGTLGRETLLWRLQVAYKHPHREYLLVEAADEIERLRADVKRWSNWAIDYACDDTKCECDRCLAVRAAWEAAVNGDR